jgi:hypothetical protein
VNSTTRRTAAARFPDHRRSPLNIRAFDVGGSNVAVLGAFNVANQLDCFKIKIVYTGLTVNS